jgi:ketosteroid isomerase-like protein
MRKLLPVSVVVVLLLGVFVWAFGAISSAPVVSADKGRESQIREASKAWDEAFNAEDLSALMALYADGAVSMPPGFPALEGKEAISQDFEYIFANFDWEHETTIVDLLMSGNVAVERGAYTMSEGGETFEAGKHIVIRQKHGNAWLVVKEIWNTDN